MEVSPAAKVGMITLLALVILGLTLSHISRMRREEGYRINVMFDNVSGLMRGNPAHRSGVTIGKVDKITILQNDRVQVTLLITYAGAVVKKNDVITVSGSIIGDKWVEIVPGGGATLVEGNEIEGQNPISADEMIASARETLQELKKTIRYVNSLIGDPSVQKNFKKTVGNVERISDDLNTITRDVAANVVKLRTRAEALLDNTNRLINGLDSQVAQVGSEINGMSRSLRRIAETNEPAVKDIVANLKDTSLKLKDAMAAVSALVTKENFSRDVTDTLSSLKKASQSVEAIASDVRSFTADEQVKEDLKATIHEARKATQGFNTVIEKVNKFMGGEKTPQSLMRTIFYSDIDLEWRTNSGEEATNANIFLFPNAENSVKLGVDSIGRGNLMNIQWCMNYKSVSARLGVVRSKAGVALDGRLGKKLQLTTEVYDPNKVQVDLTGKIFFPKDIYLTGGLRDAFDGKQPVIGIGKRF
jgi:phospholipid/cholesterol/gamma-HCH transport system substrate-binding protein